MIPRKAMTMFVRHISRRLAAHIDGELTAGAARRAETHLTQCARCRAESEEIRFGMTMMDRLPLVEAPESLWAAIQGALDVPDRRRGSPIRVWSFATIALILVAAALCWRLARQANTGWEVVRLDGSPVVGSKRIGGAAHIGAGDRVETDAVSRARIKIGEIGLVDVEANTRVRVVAALPGEHRLALRSGEITANISAPPRLFFVETPAGTAVDLGCRYKLQCDDAGYGLLRVAAGWVSFEWNGRESLVPAGASCRTRPRIGPGTPYFDDAPERMVRALEVLDFENGGASALGVVLDESRARDTLTLWHLVSRVDRSERSLVYERMAGFSAPPSGVSREQALSLDPKTLTRWREELAWTW